MNEPKTLEQAWSEFKDALKIEKPFCWIHKAMIFILDWLAEILSKIEKRL